MSESRQSRMSLFWFALLGLLLANGWIGWTTWIQRDQAQAAQAQAIHLAGLAEQIEQLRRSPTQVDAGARSSDALARIVEQAAQAAGLNLENIVRIDPGEPRRLADSPYLEQRTDVELREVSLARIVEFTIALGREETGLDVPTLALRLPGGLENPAQGEELWNAQILLTSRIYDPKIPGASPAQTP